MADLLTFFEFAWRNLTRRRLRLALTTLGLALAVAAIVALVGLADGFERSFRELYRRTGVDLIVHHSGGAMQLTRGVDADLREPIERVSGVRRVYGGLMDVIALEQYDLYAVLINGWPAESPAFERVQLTSGRRLSQRDTGRVMLGKVLAANTGKRVGDTIDIYGEPFEIAGTFESFSVYDNGAVFLLLDDLQRLTDRAGQVSGFNVETLHPEDPAFVEKVREEIEELDPSLAATVASQFVRDVSQIRVARAAAWVTSAIAILIGVAGTLNTMLMSVFERVQEIGTLRAVGWSKGRVVRMILLEALLVSSMAALVGVLVGLGAMYLMTYWPQVAGLVQGFPALAVIAQACLIAVLIGLLGAVYPAWWAARQAPVEAMRATR